MYLIAKPHPQWVTGLNEKGELVTGMVVKVYSFGPIVIRTVDGEIEVIDGQTAALAPVN